MEVPRELIRELMTGSAVQRLALKEAYARLPITSCRRQTHCCSLLPEMSLVEAVAAVHLVTDMVPWQRRQLSGRMVHYFFLNPVKIMSCPFLQGHDCLIYQERFFGCRAYGLWSREYYQVQAKRSRQTKRLSQQQWQRLGVNLPQEVVDFQVPYCPYVKPAGDASVHDEMLAQISDVIGAISGQLAPWDDLFRQVYFSDLSFLLVAICLGLQQVVQLKFEIVRDVLSAGRKEKIEDIANKLDDILGELRT